MHFAQIPPHSNGRRLLAALSHPEARLFGRREIDLGDQFIAVGVDRRQPAVHFVDACVFEFVGMNRGASVPKRYRPPAGFAGNVCRNT